MPGRLTWPAADSVYDAESVDQPVEPVRLPVEDMPLRVRLQRPR